MDPSQPACSSPLFNESSAVYRHTGCMVVVLAGAMIVPHSCSNNPQNLVQKLLPLKLQADNYVTRMGENVECVRTMEVIGDTLRFQSVSTAPRVYPSSCIISIAALGEYTRYFYIIVRGRNKHVQESGLSYYENVCRCFLYRCLPSALLPHKRHTNLANSFGIHCHLDRVTGSCWEFPHSASEVLAHFSDFIETNTADNSRRSSIACWSPPTSPEPTKHHCMRTATSIGAASLSSATASRGLMLPPPSDFRSRASSYTAGPNTVMPQKRYRHPTYAKSTAGQPSSVNWRNSVASVKTVPGIVTPKPSSNPLSHRLLASISKVAGSLRHRWREKNNETPVQKTRHSCDGRPPLSTSVFDTATPRGRTSSLVSVPCTPHRRAPTLDLADRSSSCRSVMLTGDAPTAAATYLTRRSCSPVKEDLHPCAASLDNLLDDPSGLQQFRAFLLSEYSSENIDFWCTARDWRAKFPDKQAHQKAVSIYETYVDPSGPRAVNISQNAVSYVQQQLNSPSPNMFAEAEQQVYTTMKFDAYPRFLTSSHFLHAVKSQFDLTEVSKNRNAEKIGKNTRSRNANRTLQDVTNKSTVG